MIRTDIISDYESQLKTASTFVKNFVTDFQKALTVDLQTTVVPSLLAAAKAEPPQPEHYQFSTPKSRRWYFWQVRTGKIPTENGHYKRSHKLSQGYNVRVINQDGAVVLSVRNPKWLKWVKSEKFQTIGHRINGWIPDNTPISAAATAARARAPIVAGQVVRSGRFG